MDFSLTDEQQMIKNLCDQIAEEQIKPVAAEFDESGEFPWEIVKMLPASDPASASVIANAASFFPAAMSGRYLTFCSWLPKSRIGTVPRPVPPNLRVTELSA